MSLKTLVTTENIKAITAMAKTHYAGYLREGDYVVADNTVYLVTGTQDHLRDDDRAIVTLFCTNLLTRTIQDLHYLKYADVLSIVSARR